MPLSLEIGQVLRACSCLSLSRGAQHRAISRVCPCPSCNYIKSHVILGQKKKPLFASWKETVCVAFLVGVCVCRLCLNMLASTQKVTSCWCLHMSITILCMWLCVQETLHLYMDAFACFWQCAMCMILSSVPPVPQVSVALNTCSQRAGLLSWPQLRGWGWGGYMVSQVPEKNNSFSYLQTLQQSFSLTRVWHIFCRTTKAELPL